MSDGKPGTKFDTAVAHARGKEAGTQEISTPIPRGAESMITKHTPDALMTKINEDLASGKVLYNYAMTESGIDELPGYSVFIKNGAGEVFHTYSSYGRGAEALLGIYVLLDMTPKGREENGPHHSLMDWVKRHDEYGATAKPADCCHGD